MNQRYVIYLNDKATGLRVSNVADLGAVVDVACRYGQPTIYDYESWQQIKAQFRQCGDLEYLPPDKAAEELQQLHQQD